MSVVKTVVEPDENVALNLRVLVSVIFVAGSIASFVDGILTWLVINKVGLSAEGNGFMATAMRHFGVGPVVVVRIFVGVMWFWIFCNYIVGRHFFLTRWGSRRYASRLTRPRSRLHQMLWNSRHYLLACSLVFGFAITWGVDGNNVRAYLTLFH